MRIYYFISTLSQINISNRVNFICSPTSYRIQSIPHPIYIRIHHFWMAQHICKLVSVWFYNAWMLLQAKIAPLTISEQWKCKIYLHQNQFLGIYLNRKFFSRLSLEISQNSRISICFASSNNTKSVCVQIPPVLRIFLTIDKVYVFLSGFK